jgi:enoyl-CoA hydratase/3-hydroxyacyl-CoA dehydrogenase
VPGVTDVQLKPRQIRKVAVIGGGLMGSGIATALLVSNISVVLKEVNPQFLQRGERMIAGNLEGLVKRGSLTKDKMNKAMSLLKGALDYSDFKDIDMVIEAVIEKIPLKQSIFADIEKICPKHCILATNTSTIDLNVVGEKTNSQDRIIGAHFFRFVNSD